MDITILYIFFQFQLMHVAPPWGHATFLSYQQMKHLTNDQQIQFCLLCGISLGKDKQPILLKVPSHIHIFILVFAESYRLLINISAWGFLFTCTLIYIIAEICVGLTPIDTYLLLMAVPQVGASVIAKSPMMEESIGLCNYLILQ